jgi:hypothetical protein
VVLLQSTDESKITINRPVTTFIYGCSLPTVCSGALSDYFWVPRAGDFEPSADAAGVALSIEVAKLDINSYSYYA